MNADQIMTQWSLGYNPGDFIHVLSHTNLTNDEMNELALHVTDLWHESLTTLPLDAYLGFTPKQYSMFVESKSWSEILQFGLDKC